MNRIVFGIPRWNIYLHRKERKLPLVKDDDSKDLRFQDEIFERLRERDEPSKLPNTKKDHINAPWAEWGHKACDDLELAKVKPYCIDNDFNAALAAAWFYELIEEPLEEAKAAAAAAQAAAAKEQEEALEGLSGVDMSSALAAAGADVSAGSGGAGTESQRNEKLVQYVRRDPRLNRIAQLAGRMRNSVITKQRAKRTSSSNEVVDVTLGGDLERLLPSELSRLASKSMKLIAMRDFLERKMVQYEMVVREEFERGPIIVCLDKSDSMHGARDEWATAITLSMLEIAQRQGRAFGLVSFAYDVVQKNFVRAGEKISLQDIMIGVGGGTNIPAALGAALDAIKRMSAVKQADIILISDGESVGDPKAWTKKADEQGVTIYGVGIETQAIIPWCHTPHIVENLATEGDETQKVLFGI